MKKALLIVYIDSHFTELARVAQLLKQSGNYEPLLFFMKKYQAIHRDVAICKKESITCIAPMEATIDLSKKESSVSISSWKHRAQSWIGDLIWKCVIKSKLLTIPFSLWNYKQKMYIYRRTLEGYKIDILVLAEDNVGYTTAEWIKSAHSLGIPSVIVPFTIANAKEPAEALVHNKDNSLEKWSNKLVALLYPKWVYNHNGHKLLRLPALNALTKEWLGLAPPLPWIINSGESDALAVESEFMLHHCQAKGLPSNKLVLTGALYDDVLAKNLINYSERRKHLCSELGLSDDRMLILCALPPDQIGKGASQCDFTNYAELVKFWVQSLQTLKGCNIIIRLHPRLNYDEMKYIEQWGMKISQLDTAVLIPLCDIYVACISATIRWAIACSKPVINYDVYRYGYDDYSGVDGVLTIEEKSEFLSALQRLAGDPEFYNEMVKRQAKFAGQWGHLDGQAGDRLLKLFDQLVAHYNTAP